MAKTKVQKGIKIARDGASNKFTISWDHGQKKYTDQKMTWYEVYLKTTDKNTSKRYKKAHSVTLTKGQKSKSVSISYNDYKPSGTIRLCYLEVVLKAKAKGRSWSSWSKAVTFDVQVPQAPSFNSDQMPAPLKNANTASYSWNVYDSGGKQMYHWSHYQVVELENFNGTSINEVTWDSASRVKEGYLEYSTLADYNKIDIPLSILPVGTNTVTQFFRVRTYGPQGYSKWVNNWHVFGVGNEVKDTSVEAINDTAGRIVTVSWSLDTNRYFNPSDSVVVRYTNTTPIVTRTEKENEVFFSLSCPTSPAPSWTDRSPITDTKDLDRLTFTLDSEPNNDEVSFVQVNNKHDTDDTTRYGEIVALKVGELYGRLTPPVLKSSDYNPNTRLVTIDIDHGTSVSNSYTAVYVKQGSNDPTVIGIIPFDTSRKTIALPTDISTDSSIKFAVRNLVADYAYEALASGITNYSIREVHMASSMVWAGGDIPNPPKVSLSNPEQGTILVEWDWPWSTAQSAELSWSTNKYAWESTDGPSTYVISNNHAAKWRIANLDYARYYVRVRLIQSGDNYETYGLYSDEDAYIDLTAETPPTPNLTISPGVVAPGSEVNCYWQYAAEDGSTQLQANIYQAFVDADGNISYSDTPLVATHTSQHLTIDTSALGWTAENSPYYLCIDTLSSFGTKSDRSEIVSVKIVDPLVVSFEFVDGFTSRVEDDITYYSLTKFPFTVNVVGSDYNGTTSFYIRRTTSYIIDRPDGDTTQGFENEAVFIADIEEDRTMSIEANDPRIIGSLDDGVRYDMVIRAKDQFGQVAEYSNQFTVDWDHKALIPSAEIAIDYIEYAAIITPKVLMADNDDVEIDNLDTYIVDDLCDIYRLTADLPELVFEGASFNSKYVDPYPAMGQNGGYRIVYRTKYNDFKTEEGVPGWTDYGLSDGAALNIFDSIIDFDGYQVHLPFNLSLSHKWEKDFVETKYLGGTVQGDWNPAVSHTLSINTDVAVEYYSETAQLMRLLAVYPGVCHVRTPDGSSFSANVSVSEDRGDKMIRQLAKFSLDITKIDQEYVDGITYEEWIEE